MRNLAHLWSNSGIAFPCYNFHNERYAITVKDKSISISHIQVLDKPDITWDNTEADRLYSTMASLFELNQHHLEIKHSSEPCWT